MLAFRAHPHPHIAPPLGLVVSPDANATQSLLLVEKTPSSSSLQSMLLFQMEQPQRPAYSWKSALEWLVQARPRCTPCLWAHVAPIHVCSHVALV